MLIKEENGQSYLLFLLICLDSPGNLEGGIINYYLIFVEH